MEYGFSLPVHGLAPIDFSNEAWGSLKAKLTKQSLDTTFVPKHWITIGCDKHSIAYNSQL